METNTKTKPKSCGCEQCKRGAGTPAGNARKKSEERGARRAFKNQLRLGNYENILPAHRGSYTD